MIVSAGTIVAAGIVARTVPAAIVVGAIPAAIVPRRIPANIVACPAVASVVPGVIPIPGVIPAVVAGVIPRRGVTPVAIALPIGYIGRCVALETAHALGVLIVIGCRRLRIGRVGIYATNGREMDDVVACRIDRRSAGPCPAVIVVNAALATRIVGILRHAVGLGLLSHILLRGYEVHIVVLCHQTEWQGRNSCE